VTLDISLRFARAGFKTLDEKTGKFIPGDEGCEGYLLWVRTLGQNLTLLRPSVGERISVRSRLSLAWSSVPVSWATVASSLLAIPSRSSFARSEMERFVSRVARWASASR
jgi:hypothetical protein